MRPFQWRLAKAVDRNTTTIEDYSVRVSGIPKDTTDAELLKFFGRRVGTVVDVQVAHSDGALHAMGFNRVHITQQVESSVARWKQARYALPHTARHVIHRTLNPRFLS